MSELELTKEQKEAALNGLKAKATKLGITFHPNIGYGSLKEKIETFKTFTKNKATENVAVDFQEKADKANKKLNEQGSEALLKASVPKPLQKVIARSKATRLVRCRVTCMNPAKTELRGEIFTVRNSVTPPVKKFIQFNGEPVHIPQLILNMIEERQCQIFYWKTNANGMKTRKGKLIKEFNVEILPYMTDKETQDLAKQQALAGNIG